MIETAVTIWYWEQIIGIGLLAVVLITLGVVGLVQLVKGRKTK